MQAAASLARHRAPSVGVYPLTLAAQLAATELERADPHTIVAFAYPEQM
ncbi:hypothetical protein [Streptomyces aureocirculatus]|nr:hypothetical protein [Streptomyces aureocirculatus]